MVLYLYGDVVVLVEYWDILSFFNMRYGEKLGNCFRIGRLFKFISFSDINE